MGGSTKCFSIEIGGRFVQGEVAPGARDHPERADRRQVHRFHHQSLGEFSGSGGKVKKRAMEKTNPLKKKVVAQKKRMGTWRP
jgi:hypothetical protein